jgi:hypothetical protein
MRRIHGKDREREREREREKPSPEKGNATLHSRSSTDEAWRPVRTPSNKITTSDVEHVLPTRTWVKDSKKLPTLRKERSDRSQTPHPCFCNIVYQSFPNQLPNPNVRPTDIVEDLVVSLNLECPKGDPS